MKEPDRLELLRFFYLEKIKESEDALKQLKEKLALLDQLEKDSMEHTGH